MAVLILDQDVVGLAFLSIHNEILHVAGERFDENSEHCSICCIWVCLNRRSTVQTLQPSPRGDLRG